MIEAMIPKDIRKYESKLIGPLTLRQTICFIIAAGLSFTSYTALKEISATAAQYTAFILAVIPTIFGWVKVYNLPIEKFLQTALVSHVLSPTHRVYKCENQKLLQAASDDFMPLDKKAAKKMNKQNKKAAKLDSKYRMYK